MALRFHVNNTKSNSRQRTAFVNELKMPVGDIYKKPKEDGQLIFNQIDNTTYVSYNGVWNKLAPDATEIDISSDTPILNLTPSTITSTGTFDFTNDILSSDSTIVDSQEMDICGGSLPETSNNSFVSLPKLTLNRANMEDMTPSTIEFTNLEPLRLMSMYNDSYGDNNVGSVDLNTLVDLLPDGNVKNSTFGTFATNQVATFVGTTGRVIRANPVFIDNTTGVLTATSGSVKIGSELEINTGALIDKTGGSNVKLLAVDDSNLKVGYAEVNAGNLTISEIKYTVPGTGNGPQLTTSWNTVPFNEKTDYGSLTTSLASGAVTIPAGTYRIKATQTIYKSSTSLFTLIGRIFDTTNTATLIQGFPTIFYQGNYHMITEGIFTTAGSIEIRHEIFTGTTAVNFGVNAGGTIVPQLYGQMLIEKLA